MAKTKISEFSSTPGSNTDIDGINIAEGCAPSGINDAIRELMAQLKDFQTGAAGDSFNGPVGTTTAVAGAFTTLSASSTTTLSGLTASTALALDASKNVVSVTNTGTGNNVLATSPTLVTPALGTPSSATLTNATGLPISTGVSGLGTGIATALAVNVGTAGAPVINGGALGTPSSGTVTNLTGTASININGTVGATTPTTGAFTTLSASSDVTLSGGTANGVAYLNGSKVLTTGSALTFDGTSFGVGANITASAAAAPSFTVGTGSGSPAITLYSSTTGSSQISFADATSGSGAYDGYILYDQNSQSMQFGRAAAEQMRLTSTGLGIGTSSPGEKLEVAGKVKVSTAFPQIILNRTASSYQSDIKFTLNGTNQWSIGQALGAVGSNLEFYDYGASATRMVLDTSGNLGLGVTPTSGWRSGDRNMQIGPVMSLTSDTNVTSDVGYNYYYNTSNFPVYLTNAQASRYSQYQGAHRWFTAGSGTAGNTISFTQAMTLDASGNLLVKTTTARANITTDADLVTQNGLGIVATSTTYGQAYQYIRLMNSAAAYAGSISQTASTGIGLYSASDLILGSSSTERARIDSSGNLLVGTTDPSNTAIGFKTNVNGTTIVHTSASAFGQPLLLNREDSDGDEITFRRANSTVGTISVTTSATAYNTSSDYRLKENIAAMTGALSVVQALKPCTYTWKSDGSAGQGFIAHELQEVVPDCVTGEKDAVDAEGKPVYQGIDTSFLVATLTAAIQEQQAQIAQLTQRLAAAGIA